MNEEEIKKAVDFIVKSHELEGLHISAETKKDMVDILQGTLDADESIAKSLAKLKRRVP